MQYPGLFTAAERLSRDGQNKQKSFVGFSLLANFAAAALASPAEHYLWAAVGMFACLVAGVGLSFALLILKPQADWYNGRAVAESVKTLAWRFATCTEPYRYGLSEKEADLLFVGAMRKVLEEASSITAGLFTEAADSLQITDDMRMARRADTCDRRDFYLEARVKDQQGWYARSSQRNRKMERAWSGAFIVTQMLALIFAGLALTLGSTSIIAVGIITTLGSGMVAWQQQNQFGALASAYSVTSQELSLIQTSMIHCSTDKELSDFILSAERAISREHTFWLARRREP
ncbi:MAG: DUF4231 domain-containing protein [Acidobacteria bacterium]|nr:DUF4231 domain-containing protein [Acidobacteriota bacterium]